MRFIIIAALVVLASCSAHWGDDRLYDASHGNDCEGCHNSRYYSSVDLCQLNLTEGN